MYIISTGWQHASKIGKITKDFASNEPFFLIKLEFFGKRNYRRV